VLNPTQWTQEHDHTDDGYLRPLFPGQEAESVGRLPKMLGDHEPIALRATGTDDVTAAMDDTEGWLQSGLQFPMPFRCIRWHPMASPTVPSRF
jgi:hypothetical protein